MSDDKNRAASGPQRSANARTDKQLSLRSNSACGSAVSDSCWRVTQDFILGYSQSRRQMLDVAREWAPTRSSVQLTH
jgi:hypothetical protein